MKNSKQISLFITLIFWGTLMGGVMYSHIAYFPPYLSHLPASTQLINGDFGIHDENFWLVVHPCTILSLLVTVFLNWKLVERRKFILITIGIYALALVATGIYFVPELMAFANSKNSNISPTEWYERGQKWQHLSWIRGAFINVGFVMLLIALTKNEGEKN
jgi:hypothetical protein